MQHPVENKLAVAFGIVFAAVAVITICAIHGIRTSAAYENNLLEQERWLEGLHHFEKALLQLEANETRLLLLSDEDYRSGLKTGLAQLPALLPSGRPELKQQVAYLSVLVQERVGLTAAFLDEDRHIQSTSELRQRITEIQKIDRAILLNTAEMRNALTTEPRSENLLPVIIASGLLTLLAGLIFIQLIRKQLRALHALELERETNRAELDASHRELESFTYTVSHDLRAPLRVMKGFAQVLEEDHSGELNPDAVACVHRISDAASRMDLLIHDLLEYSRLTRQKIEYVPVDLEKVSRGVLQELDPEIRKTGAEIRIASPLRPVLGHAGMLHQVLLNLISNAMKFVAPGAKPDIEIRTEQQGDHVRVEVRDRGIGVDPQYQERIFKVFERLHGIETYPGTGIGLAIVRKAMERMHGRCGLDSKLGEGSIFWFDLRVAPAPGDAA